MAIGERDDLEQEATNESSDVYVSPPLAEQSPANETRAAGDQMQTVQNAGRAIGEALSNLSRTIDARIKHECREHPYRSLAAAAAMGFAVRNGQAARLLMLAGSKYAVQAFAAARAESEA